MDSALFSLAERIRAAGHERRKLGELPDDWTQLIKDFQRDFPNFAELAEVLHDFAQECTTP